MSRYPTHPIPTSLVGSYPQPRWLVDREMLSKMVPRVRTEELWRVPAADLAEAQDDATTLAVRDQERAGIDIVTDGEIRRESYFNRFATALDGLDAVPGNAIGRTGLPTPVPRVVGPLRRVRPVEVDDVRYLRSLTDRPIKITVPGPFTMTQLAENRYYRDEEALAEAYADAVNAEIRDLFAAGADVVQIDEPYLQAQPEKAASYGVQVLDRALEGIEGMTAVHLCFGYAQLVSDKPSAYSFLPKLAASRAKQISIEAAQPHLDPAVLGELGDKQVIYGVIDLADPKAETPEVVAGRLRAALRHIPADRLVAAPDCGMKYLPRDLAYAKLKALVDGARMVREAL